MNDGKKYKTKQREYILECVKQKEGQYVTVQQIATYLKLNDIKVGLTTIYRTIDKLVQDGKIIRLSVDGKSGFCYKYLTEMKTKDFFSLKCEKCGNVVSIECPELIKLYEHLSAEHRVHIDSSKTMMYGVCEHCENLK